GEHQSCQRTRGYGTFSGSRGCQACPNSGNLFLGAKYLDASTGVRDYCTGGNIAPADAHCTGDAVSSSCTCRFDDKSSEENSSVGFFSGTMTDELHCV